MTEQMHILQQIDEGAISATEGMRLLRALAERLAPPPSAPSDLEIASWKRWWEIPLGLGIALSVISVIGLFWLYTTQAGVTGWFILVTLPLLFGVALAFVAWASRSARWLHIRVKTNDPVLPRIALSFPVPIHLTAWFLRTFGDRIPKLKDTGVDELIIALGESATPETPLYVSVDDSDDGEQVQVYLG